jgi:hypothetical protein
VRSTNVRSTNVAWQRMPAANVRRTNVCDVCEDVSCGLKSKSEEKQEAILLSQ